MAAVAAVFLGLDFAWIDLHHDFLYDDAHPHLMHLVGLAWRPLETPYPYPPLPYRVVLAGWNLLGMDIRVAQKSLACCSVPFVFATWAWARFHLKPTGSLLVALVAAGAPWLTTYGRLLGLEVVSAACLAGLMAALAWSRGFTRPLPTLLIGLGAGAGLLASLQFLSFALLPWLVAGVRTWRGGRTARVLLLGAAGVACLVLLVLAPFSEREQLPTQAWVATIGLALLLVALAGWLRHSGSPSPGLWNPGAGLALSVGLALVLSLPWYLDNFASIQARGLDTVGHPHSLGVTLPQYLLQIGTTWTGAFLLLPFSMVACLRTRSLRDSVLTALAATALGVLAIADSGARWLPRYILSATPLLVFAGMAPLAWQVDRLGRLLKAGILIGALALSLMQVGSFLWAPGALPLNLRQAPSLTLGRIVRTLPPNPVPYPWEAVLAHRPAGLLVCDLFPEGRSWSVPADRLEALAGLRGLEMRFEIRRAGSPAPPPDPRGFDFLLLIRPEGIPREQAFRDFPWLEVYQPVQSWRMAHPPAWCTPPWETAYPPCASSGHRFEIQLLRRTGDAETSSGTLPGLLQDPTTPEPRTAPAREVQWAPSGMISERHVSVQWEPGKVD